VGLIHHSPSQSYKGYTLLTTNGGDHATLVDMEGRVCHRWQSHEGIGYAYLLPNGHLLCRTAPAQDVDIVNGLGGSSAALLELDWDSQIVWEYRNPMLHHDYERLSNGNTLVLLWEPLAPELSRQVQGGMRSEQDPDHILEDVVSEITPDGRSTYAWHAGQHFSLEEDIICPLENRREWGHGNSLNVTPEGDLLVSFRRTDTVGIVDRASGAFKWKWGRGELGHQHHPTYLDNGNVLLFDNGAHTPRMAASRVLEVHPATNEIVWKYEGTPPMSFYSHHISSAERLANGNTLICEGAAGRIFEVLPNQSIVWEYINPFFYPDRRSGASDNATFRAHRYGPEHPALQGKDLDPKLFSNLNRLYNRS
jgi:hypothetical protein